MEHKDGFLHKSMKISAYKEVSGIIQARFKFIIVGRIEFKNK